MPRRRHGGNSTRRRFNNRRRSGGYRRTRKIFRRSTVRRRVGHRRVQTRRRFRSRHRSRSRGKAKAHIQHELTKVESEQPVLYRQIVGATVTVSASSGTKKACEYYFGDRANGFSMGIHCMQFMTSMFLSAIKRQSRFYDYATNTFGDIPMTGFMPTLVIAQQKCISTAFNQSNANCDVTVYKLRVRHDLPFIASTQDPVEVIGQALSSANLDVLNPNASNANVTDDTIDIFQLKTFVRDYQVLKSWRTTLLPGVPKRFVLTQKGVKTWHYNRFYANNVSSGDADNMTRLLNNVQGHVFYLFKLSGTLGTAVTGGPSPSYSTPNIIWEHKYSALYITYLPRANFNTTNVSGFGSGGTFLREPFDMDYKASTNV